MKEFKQIFNAYNLIGLILVSLSIWNVFTGIDAADSPYHLFHYKARITSAMAFLSGLFGVYLVSFIELIGEARNTMIILRIINWGLIVSPFFWVLTFRFTQVKSNLPIFLILFCISLPTNWNTLCWDSWNRFYWFLMVFVLLKNLRDEIFKYPILIALLTLIGIGIKVTNIFTVPLLVVIFGLDSNRWMKWINVKQLGFYVIATLMGFVLFFVYESTIFEFYGLQKYIPEIDNGSHDVINLFMGSFEHLVLFVFVKVMVYLLTRRNAFESHEGMVVFITISILGASFYSFHNSIVALLVVFLYVEFLLFQKSNLGRNVLAVLILAPLFYAAGSDTGLFKAYWIIPQSLLLLYFFDESFFHKTKSLNFAIPKSIATVMAVLSISTLVGNELYKSSLMVNCSKTLDIVPFNNIKVSYYDKMSYKSMGMFAMKNWDYNPNNTNVILGSTSFLFANTVLFENWDTIPQNHYIFRTIHTDLNGISNVMSVFNTIRNLNKVKEVSNIFYFGVLNDNADIIRDPEKFDVKLIEKEGHMFIFKYLGNGRKN